MHLPNGKETNLTNDQERDVLARVANGDRDAMTHLFSIYHRRLFNFVYRLTSSFSIAEELVNDIMLLVWQKASTFRGESRVSTWIFGIAYRQTMRRVTRKQLETSSSIDVDTFPADGEGMTETEDWILHGLHKLPAAQQLATVLVFYLGLSYEETAAVAGCPVNTIKTRMFHARRKLREYLEASALPSQRSNETTDEQ
ncbi:MAG: RNA polymerase sigma factor [Woeseiaceae bacterium]